MSLDGDLINNHLIENPQSTNNTTKPCDPYGVQKLVKKTLRKKIARSQHSNHLSTVCCRKPDAMLLNTALRKLTLHAGLRTGIRTIASLDSTVNKG